MVDLSDFKVSHYPDGHKHVVSDKDLHGDTTLSASIRTFDDLFLVAQVRRIHPELTTLAIKYLLAGRCDRRFSPGEAVDLEIVCSFIRSLGFQEISVLKPHSDKTMQLLASLGHSTYERDVTESLLKMCYQDLGTRHEVCHVSPDEGASHWIGQYRLNNVIQGLKKRNADGAVSSITLDIPSKYLDCPNFIIVDDLCDGGGTFVAIAKAIKDRIPHAKVYLVVTHAIFSKGFKPFEGLIDRIYCTDSFAVWERPLIRQLKI